MDEKSKHRFSSYVLLGLGVLIVMVVVVEALDGFGSVNVVPKFGNPEFLVNSSLIDDLNNSVIQMSKICTSLNGLCTNNITTNITINITINITNNVTNNITTNLTVAQINSFDLKNSSYNNVSYIKTSGKSVVTSIEVNGSVNITTSKFIITNSSTLMVKQRPLGSFQAGAIENDGTHFILSILGQAYAVLSGADFGAGQLLFGTGSGANVQSNSDLSYDSGSNTLTASNVVGASTVSGASVSGTTMTSGQDTIQASEGEEKLTRYYDTTGTIYMSSGFSFTSGMACSEAFWAVSNDATLSNSILYVGRGDGHVSIGACPDASLTFYTVGDLGASGNIYEGGTLLSSKYYLASNPSSYINSSALSPYLKNNSPVKFSNIIDTGNFNFSNVNSTISYKSGTDACAGLANLSASKVTINTKCFVNGISQVLLTRQRDSGTIGGALDVVQRGTNTFNVSATGVLDTSEFLWVVININ